MKKLLVIAVLAIAGYFAYQKFVDGPPRAIEDPVYGEVRVDIDVQTLSIGNRPASCIGTVFRPGPDPRVVLDFAADALPVDDVLLKAMPPDVREVIDHFHPRGTVRGALHLVRSPRAEIGPDRDDVAITADIHLDESGHCSIVWDDLPYPITKLTGLLKIRPDQWIFEEMRGWNGVAEITGKGQPTPRRVASSSTTMSVVPMATSRKDGLPTRKARSAKIHGT